MHDAVFLAIRRLIASHLDVAQPDTILPETTLRDLGADSLDDVEIIMAVEDRFDIDLPDSESATVVTVGDLAKLARSHGAQAEPPQDLSFHGTLTG